LPKANLDLLALNRGLVSPLALARVDVERTRLSAAEMTNWTAKTQGAMRLRTGDVYLGSSLSDAKAGWIPFVASTSDTALIELTDQKMRVWVNDALITRPSVSTTISNGSFATSAGWTDASTGGGVVTMSGQLILNGTNINGAAIVTRQITVAAPDQNIEHALNIIVAGGPVTFRVGSTSGGQEYIAETTLLTGNHSLAFTPTGDFHLTFRHGDIYPVYLSTIAVASAGVMEITTPWPLLDIPGIRSDQSADVVFVACGNALSSPVGSSFHTPRRIERRGTGRSWSVVLYQPDNGPFVPERTSKAKLKVSATFGNTTLTASENFFTSAHVGAIFRLFHTGQNGVFRFGSADAYSPAWEVNGIGAATERRSTIVTTGTWTANIRVQRSFDGPDEGFRTVQTITTNTTTNIDDADDNVTVWYRLAIPVTADYTSGTAIATLTYTGGGVTGICRVLAYNSATTVTVNVLKRFSLTEYTDNWNEGQWSDKRGHPTSAALFEGRLWWFGGSQAFGSVSDDYANYDDETEGESAPIVKTIGRGPVDSVYWALPLQRMLLGTAGQEIAMQSSSLDEPLTSQNTAARTISTQGSADVAAVVVDTRGIFVQRSGKRVFMLDFDLNQGTHQAQELSLLVPDLLDSGVVSLAVQRQPDTRFHCVLGDGRVAVLTFEKAEEVLCWAVVETDGFVEAAIVLPGTDEDQLYYHVRRVINGQTKRYLEKFSLERECHYPQTIYSGTSTSSITDLPYADGTAVTLRDASGVKLENQTVTGGTITLASPVTWAEITPSRSGLVDSAKHGTQSASATITGLSHLEGEAVVVWADGKSFSPIASGVQTTFTVSAGQITLPETVQEYSVGLGYSAPWQSTKMAYAAAAGTALNQIKRLDHIAFILYETHNGGLFYGRDYDHMDCLPQVRKGATVRGTEIFNTYDELSYEFPGSYDTDSRICLKAFAPHAATVMAAVPSLRTEDKI